MADASTLIDAGVALASKSLLERDVYENELIAKLFGDNVPLNRVKITLQLSQGLHIC
jgi:hypothetical protein